MDDCPQIRTGDDDDGPSAASSAFEARRAELRAAVKRGLEDIEEGRVVDLEPALDRIEAMLDELEAATPSQA
jgi:predicted transcriptional regulator